ncbi:MAG TPA: hypothetical protein VGN72_19595 [Tepidisphaeraceae bacterium]|nr:hypothetical protein [Tepidisphaeraceae bacterium]
MSPLTKTFVALHVIISAMLVAGVIVFVNKQQDFRADADAATARAQRAENQRIEETQALAAEVSTYKSNVNTMAGTVDTLKASLADAQRRNNEQAATLADASSKSALQLAENAKLAEAVKASQDAQTKLNDAVAQLRGTLDTRVTEASQLNSRISDLTNQLDVTERERRFLAEQLADARSTVDRIGNQARAAGIEVDSPNAVAAGARVGPPINGVIRKVEDLAGSMYATISVGSADSVSKGMQFNVVERGTGKFLGTLTVTAVEANEAAGRIAGPETASIAPGAEVKTQL